MAKQDAAIGEMEKKHKHEQDTLFDLVHSVQNEADAVVALETASKIPSDERLEKLGLMGIKRKKLREKAKGFVDAQMDENFMNVVYFRHFLSFFNFRAFCNCLPLYITKLFEAQKLLLTISVFSYNQECYKVTG